MNQRVNGWRITIFVLTIIVSFLASACNTSGTETPTIPSASTATNTGPTPTLVATYTPTPAPLGSKENPITLGLISLTTNPEVTNGGNQVAIFLTKQTGYYFQASVFDSYPSLLSAIEEGNVYLAWLPPFTYILENERGLVNIALMANHYGVYAYGTMFLADINSGFTSYFDPNNNRNTADAATALAQLNGKRPCLVDPSSASGYVVPIGVLASEKITYQEPVVIQSFSSVIRALYIGQICDYGTSYAILGDVRTASSIQDSFPDVMQRIIILWQTDPIIPNLGLAYSREMPKGISQLVTDALVNWVDTPEGKTALTNANQYDIADLKQVDDSFYAPLKALLTASAININDLVGR